MSIMLIMSCYTGFFNVRRWWQSLNTGPRFTSHPKDELVVNLYIPHNRRTPLQAEEALVGLTPFRGLVPLGRRNLVPILPPAHTLGGGWVRIEKTPLYLWIWRRQLFKYNTQCRLNAWTRWAVARVPHANLCMLRSEFFLMFKHWFCWKYQYMFNFIGHLYFYSSEWLCRWDPSTLLCPVVYNAVKTALTILLFLKCEDSAWGEGCN